MELVLKTICLLLTLLIISKVESNVRKLGVGMPT